ncbi:PQQ-dependent sugar dehydrogenase [Actinoplanes sp. NPDC051343]|uniref:PQQ-dependent sugar dehydrogenase n=1 Tax=Actinoplanes sp. NPDC051343 TaxID=3363906 RepID=UPI00379B76D8
MLRRLSLLAAAATAVLINPAVAVAHPGHRTLPPDSAFQKVTLDDFPGEPIALAVLPDLRVLHTARSGEVRIHEPSTGRNVLAAKIPIYQHDEEGVQGIAIDPGFSRNHWVYIYYSPPLNTPADDPTTGAINEGDAPADGTDADFAPFKGVMRLSRFKLDGNTLQLGTEQKILEVGTDRGMCCHVGGKIDFDSKGNLYLSTGDDSNPYFSDGFAPIDERPGRNPVFDAQRSAGNTNDLRGKLLRIKVRPDGDYTIPKGNLFPPGTPKTRPEIYAMGLRNPFRFAVDRTTDVVYLGDYSPDAETADPLRGPNGHGRWMAIDKPANYGWPYCAAPDLPYVDYDFATGVSGKPFDCAHLVNDSPHNTGLRNLPPVEKPELTYENGPSARFPELGSGGIGPMGGPAYHYDPRNPSTTKWPAAFDGLPLFGEWTRDYVEAFHLDRHHQITGMDALLPSFVFDNPMDMQFGPDGSLYVLEYGDGYFAENPEAQLSRIDYVRGDHSPVPKATANPTYGQAPLTVAFSSAGTTDPDGDALTYAWDFDADGTVDSTAPDPSWTFTRNGNYRPTLKVTDSKGRSASAEVILPVGTLAPQLTFVTPVSGQPFQFGDTVDYEVHVVDDQPVDCSKVSVTYVLGHEQHGHPMSTYFGCTGSITTFLDAGHVGAHDLTAVFVASYTDTGDPPQTGTAAVYVPPTS